MPKVLLARFQRESLPFLVWGGFAGDPPSEGFESEADPCDFEAIMRGKEDEVQQHDQQAQFQAASVGTISICTQVAHST